MHSKLLCNGGDGSHGQAGSPPSLLTDSHSRPGPARRKMSCLLLCARRAIGQAPLSPRPPVDTREIGIPRQERVVSRRPTAGGDQPGECTGDSITNSLGGPWRRLLNGEGGFERGRAHKCCTALVGGRSARRSVAPSDARLGSRASTRSGSQAACSGSARHERRRRAAMVCAPLESHLVAQRATPSAMKSSVTVAKIQPVSAGPLAAKYTAES